MGESEFVATSCYDEVDFCPFRGPDAPFCAPQMLPRGVQRQFVEMVKFTVILA